MCEIRAFRYFRPAKPRFARHPAPSQPIVRADRWDHAGNVLHELPRGIDRQSRAIGRHRTVGVYPNKASDETPEYVSFGLTVEI
jgi:hypothetical protein